MSNKKPSRDKPSEGAVPNTVSQPDIDDILAFHHDKDPETGECVYAPHLIKQALYQRLAAEAVELPIHSDMYGPLIPLSALKAIMEIKES